MITHRDKNLFYCFGCFREFTQNTEKEAYEKECKYRRYECYICNRDENKKPFVTKIKTYIKRKMSTLEKGHSNEARQWRINDSTEENNLLL